MNRTLTGAYAIRSWRASDEPSLARHANSRAVWRNLRDAFPHPYEPRHARAFLERVGSAPTETIFCISFEDEAVGGIGLHPRTDVERPIDRFTELGAGSGAELVTFDERLALAARLEGFRVLPAPA